MTAGRDEVLAAARSGNEIAFAELVERHRRELRVHCYRMLGSFDDAEDLLQETLLRAWKGIAGFEGRASVRGWLYTIATNACLDALRGRSRRVLPQHLGAPSGLDVDLPPRTDIPWLQPFPDRLWEPAAPAETEPDAVIVGRETIELAFLAAIQHLPPRQRAVLLLRDVLGWPARDTATALESSVASVTSALQRARDTLRERLPERRVDWAVQEPTDAERAVLRRYMDAMNRADVAGVAALLAEDVRAAMPPLPMWYLGRATVEEALTLSWDPTGPAYIGRFHAVAVDANGHPAAAAYLCPPGGTVFEACAIGVPVIADGMIVELTSFHDPGLFAAFGLPMTFQPG
ncbi:sigma-70 family RNA polymerase sigma factor [Pseudonocardia sp. TRM90224]|uniref:sigma-70 family RNA polymerase sigma factor n=1 Tax=Pseudonocardia sp. TRM90224 TaxID=2812678 RepID=UPI001E643ABC|nr:sigma-70 family RNA polymerase sigma factor [Pseudonocardia sp. TRM90224]